MIDFRELIKAGVHFGHITSRWCPKMRPYIWGHKNKTHLIDVSKTAYQLEKATQFLKDVAARGEHVLFVGTKKPAQKIIKAVATEVDMPYVVHRWIGGTLSNYGQVKKSVTKLLHLEDIVARADKFPHYTKKEMSEFQKDIQRLEKCIGGIRSMRWPISALVVVDVARENSALKEAVRMGIPVVAIVDTNSDPSLVDYVIPANDDAPRSIEIILNYLKEAVVAGKQLIEKQEEEEAIASADKVTTKELEGGKAKKQLKKGATKKMINTKVKKEEEDITEHIVASGTLLKEDDDEEE